MENTIKTPRGTFKIQEVFTSFKEAKEAGYYSYFTNDDRTEILTKHIGENRCLFAIIKNKVALE